MPLPLLFFHFMSNRTLYHFYNQRVRSCRVDSWRHDPVPVLKWLQNPVLHSPLLRGCRVGGGMFQTSVLDASLPPRFTTWHGLLHLPLGHHWESVTGEEAETLAEPRAKRVPSRVSAGGFTLAAADRTVDGGHAGQGGPLWRKLIGFPHNLLPAAK